MSLSVFCFVFVSFVYCVAVLKIFFFFFLGGGSAIFGPIMLDNKNII